MTCLETIYDQTSRSLWTLENVIRCVADNDWEKQYCAMPVWKHIYHTVHSLDRWYRNPFDYEEPPFHLPGLDNLDTHSDKMLSKGEIELYFFQVAERVYSYIRSLNAAQLQECPAGCPYSRFHLILAQHRHLDMHIGMLMGFFIADEGKWPQVMGIDTSLSQSPDGSFF